MDSEEELFPTQNRFLQEVLKRNFNTLCIIGEIRGDLESDLSDLQNYSLSTKIWRKYYSRNKIKQGQTDSRKLSAHRRMASIREFKIWQRQRQWFDWLNEEKQSCYTCSTLFGAILLRSLPNDDVKFSYLRFWPQLEPAVENL